MNNVNKRPLDFNEYDNYEISHNYSAFEITFNSINKDDLEQFENDYLDQGDQVVVSEVMRLEGETFKFRLVILKGYVKE